MISFWALFVFLSKLSLDLSTGWLESWGTFLKLLWTAWLNCLKSLADVCLKAAFYSSLRWLLSLFMLLVNNAESLINELVLRTSLRRNIRLSFIHRSVKSVPYFFYSNLRTKSSPLVLLWTELTIHWLVYIYDTIISILKTKSRVSADWFVFINYFALAYLVF